MVLFVRQEHYYIAAVAGLFFLSNYKKDCSESIFQEFVNCVDGSLSVAKFGVKKFIRQINADSRAIVLYQKA